MGRAPCCDKANVKKGPWSPEEDAKLKSYIEKFGTGGNWIALPQKIGLKRCGKSCRLRWLNYLRPNIKHGGFTDEEDNTILNLYISIGSRWSIIAAQLPGRTDNDIKNYWNTKLKKKLLGRRKQSNKSAAGDPSLLREGGAAEDPMRSSSYTPTLSSSAVERLQLHMQLQALQNPLSFYNNPALWPKLHPLQEKMIRNLQTSSSSIEPSIPAATSIDLGSQISRIPRITSPLLGNSLIAGLYDQNKPKLGGGDHLQVEEMENSSFNGSTSSNDEGSVGLTASLNPRSYHLVDQIQQYSGTADFGTDELDNLLLSNDRMTMMGLATTDEFNYYKTTADHQAAAAATKDGMMTMTSTTNWWSPNNTNDNDNFVGQGSSKCWDSTAPAANCLQPSPDNVFAQDYSLGYSM